MQSQNALPEISDSGDVPAESAVIPCQLEADELSAEDSAELSAALAEEASVEASVEASDDASEELESAASSVTVA